MGDLLQALHASKLCVGYGDREVLASLDLTLASGELLALIGHNGAGKSTLLKAIAGTIPISGGSIVMQSRSLTGLSVRERIDLGLTYLPQGNPVFSRLTVRDNLRLRVLRGVAKKEEQQEVDDALAAIPGLRDRESQIAGTLSGGEKQMLSLAGALLSRPKFLLLDEPSLGLAPALVSAALDRLRELAHQRGLGILLVEQRVREAIRVCDRLMVLRQGRVVYEGSSFSIGSDYSRLRDLLL